MPRYIDADKLRDEIDAWLEHRNGGDCKKVQVMFAEQPELKPCPFCGSEAEYHECETDYPVEHKDCYVICSNPSCRARIERNTRVEDHITKGLVVGLWNRREKNDI